MNINNQSGILPTCVNRLAKYCGLFGDHVKTGRTVAGKINEKESCPEKFEKNKRKLRLYFEKLMSTGWNMYKCGQC